MNDILSKQRPKVIKETRKSFRSNFQFYDSGLDMETPKSKASSKGVYHSGGGGAIFKSVERSSGKKCIKRQNTFTSKI